MRHMLFAAILALLLSGCLTVYKTEIQQGNVVTQEMIDKLKPGMTRSQVRFVLGTPLIVDPFHPDRWDYYYYLRRANETAGETQRVTVVFKNDLLIAVQGDTRIKSGDPATRESAVKPAPGGAPAKSDAARLRAL
ncbi:MAG: outer membrane protein assembly factor BamE [Gammaproteobacteria bacterium]|nr:outer membrane protein assembly factor BamE [Gammaproteobacteria bacterium]